jgi:asparagine synthase (glutamine-hydrolysing)
LDSSSVYSTVFDVIRNGAGSRVPDDAQKAFVATFPGLLSDERHYAEEALSFTNGPAIFLDQQYANLGEQIIADTVKFDGMSNIPITSISGIYRGMRNHGITVSMDGHGVDEMLYGYRDMIYNLFYYYYNKGDKRNAKLVRDVMVPTYHESERARVLADLQNTMKNSRSPLWKGKQMIRSIIGKPISDRSEYRVPEELRTLGEPYDFSEMNYPDRIVYAETFVETLPDIFRDFDLAAMANGVEIRMPFMDYRLVSFIFSLPMESKIGNGFTKLILRDAMKGKMSEPIRTRQHKIGIGSPLEHWFRNDLKDWALDILSSDEKRTNPMLVDSNFLPDLEKAYADNTVTKEQIFLAWKEINLHTIA